MCKSGFRGAPSQTHHEFMRKASHESSKPHNRLCAHWGSGHSCSHHPTSVGNCRPQRSLLMTGHNVGAHNNSSLNKLDKRAAPVQIAVARQEPEKKHETLSTVLHCSHPPSSNDVHFAFSDRLVNSVLREAHASWPRITMSRDESRCSQLFPCRGAHT